MMCFSALSRPNACELTSIFLRVVSSSAAETMLPVQEDDGWC